MRLDALRHDDRQQLRHNFLLPCASMRSTRLTLSFPALFADGMQVKRHAPLFATFTRVGKALCRCCSARQNSGRSRTRCSLADSRDGRVLRPGEAKLIEASLIRTLAKWSPQDAEAGEREREGAGDQKDSKQSIFSFARLHPLGSLSSSQMKIRYAESYSAFIV